MFNLCVFTMTKVSDIYAFEMMNLNNIKTDEFLQCFTGHGVHQGKTVGPLLTLIYAKVVKNENEIVPRLHS